MPSATFIGQDGQEYKVGGSADVPAATPATETAPGQPGVVALAAFDDTESDDKAAPAAAIGANCLGVNQAWQNVTAQRTVSTTYTNTTGKPISFSVNGYGSSGQLIALNMYIDGIFVSRDSLPTGYALTICGLIPPGSTYRLESATFSSIGEFSWYELR